MTSRTVMQFGCDVCGETGIGEGPSPVARDALPVGLPDGWAQISVQMPARGRWAAHLDRGHLCATCVEKFWAHRDAHRDEE